MQTIFKVLLSSFIKEKRSRTRQSTIKSLKNKNASKNPNVLDFSKSYDF